MKIGKYKINKILLLLIALTIGVIAYYLCKQPTQDAVEAPKEAISDTIVTDSSVLSAETPSADTTKADSIK